MAAYYLFDNVEVSDPEALARYFPQAAKLVAQHGGDLGARLRPASLERQQRHQTAAFGQRLSHKPRASRGSRPCVLGPG
jgi:uncharacterized protein (DUF1330 family)